MHKINWKVRFRNPTFWARVFVAIVTPIFSYGGYTGRDITTWWILLDIVVESLKNPYVFFTIIISIGNTISDPTTKGIFDSKKALTYEKPNESD